ncbi:unnamed protein product, partial [Ectocarpus fasciculatus]
KTGECGVTTLSPAQEGKHHPTRIGASQLEETRDVTRRQRCSHGTESPCGTSLHVQSRQIPGHTWMTGNLDYPRNSNITWDFKRDRWPGSRNEFGMHSVFGVLVPAGIALRLAHFETARDGAGHNSHTFSNQPRGSFHRDSRLALTVATARRVATHIIINTGPED